jgi:competence protein ComEC
MGTGDENKQVLRARRRAISALVLFAIGTLVGAHLIRSDLGHLGVWSFAIGGVSVAVGVLGPRILRVLLLSVCVLLLGTGWTMMRVDPQHPDRLDAMLARLNPTMVDSGQAFPVEIRGTLVRSSRVVHRARGLADPPMWPDSTTRAELWVESVLVHTGDGRTDWVRSVGTCRLVLADGHALRAGERVELLGRFSGPSAARNPGDPDWGTLAAQRGFVGTIIVEDPSHARLIEPGGLITRARSGLARVRAELRDRALLSVGIDESRPSDARVTMRSALLLGERDPTFDDVFTKFQRVGVAHVLAISGFHLALVVFMCTLGVRMLGEHPRLETMVIVLILLGVLVLIPLRPPIVRAAVIVGSMLLSHRLGRRYDRMTILAWVGLGLLVWRPLDATSMGYQLSMGITALLVTLSDARTGSLLDRQASALVPVQSRSRSRALLGWCADVVRVNAACWLVALPTIAYHAGVVGVLAPIASIVLVPMIAVMMALGYIQIIIGIVSPGIAERKAWIIDNPSGWTVELVTWIEGLSFAWARVPSVSGLWALVMTFVLTLIVTRPARLRQWTTVGALVIVCVWGFMQPRLSRADALVRVVMMDVGDGTCVVVQSGSRGILWDCGSLDRRVGESVARSLRTLGVSTLDAAIITHDNLDHFNGLPELSEHVPIGRVYITPRLDADPSSGFSRVRSDIETRGIEVSTITEGDAISLGGYPLKILWPSAGIAPSLDDNDTSLVALLELPLGGSVLLTGDIEGPAMDRIRIAHPDLPSRLANGVIELPHHGSAREKAYSFVAWLDPSVILQSTGASRLNDERWDAQRPGRDWYTTAERGAVVIEIDRRGRITHRYWFGE